MRLVSRSPKGLLFIFLLIIGVILAARFLFTGESSTQTDSTSEDGIVEAKEIQSLDREFIFPLNDGEKDVSEVKFFIDDVELREEIVVQGQKAVAVPGRIFFDSYPKSIKRF